jgi:hypothetical protein
MKALSVDIVAIGLLTGATWPLRQNYRQAETFAGEGISFCGRLANGDRLRRSGIGRAIALGFAREGASVAAFAFDPE